VPYTDEDVGRCTGFKFLNPARKKLDVAGYPLACQAGAGTRQCDGQPEPDMRYIAYQVHDTWPAFRQTYHHLPSLRASPPCDRYQVILLGDRNT